MSTCTVFANLFAAFRCHYCTRAAWIHFTGRSGRLPAVVRPAVVQSPELNTTCYLSTSESCWTER